MGEKGLPKATQALALNHLYQQSPQVEDHSRLPLVPALPVALAVLEVGRRWPFVRRLVFDLVQPFQPKHFPGGCAFFPTYFDAFFQAFFSAPGCRFLHLAFVGPKGEYHIDNLRRKLDGQDSPGKYTDGVSADSVPDVQPPNLAWNGQMAIEWRAGGKAVENRPCCRNYRFGPGRNPDPPGCSFLFPSPGILNLRCSYLNASTHQFGKWVQPPAVCIIPWAAPASALPGSGGGWHWRPGIPGCG